MIKHCRSAVAGIFCICAKKKLYTVMSIQVIIQPSCPDDFTVVMTLCSQSSAFTLGSEMLKSSPMCEKKTQVVTKCNFSSNISADLFFSCQNKSAEEAEMCCCCLDSCTHLRPCVCESRSLSFTVAMWRQQIGPD